MRQLATKLQAAWRIRAHDYDYHCILCAAPALDCIFSALGLVEHYSQAQPSGHAAGATSPETGSIESDDRDQLDAVIPPDPEEGSLPE